MLLRLAYLGVANVFALLQLLPVSNEDKDAEILALRPSLSAPQEAPFGRRCRVQRSAVVRLRRRTTGPRRRHQGGDHPHD